MSDPSRPVTPRHPLARRRRKWPVVLLLILAMVGAMVGYYAYRNHQADMKAQASAQTDMKAGLKSFTCGVNYHPNTSFFASKDNWRGPCNKPIPLKGKADATVIVWINDITWRDFSESNWGIRYTFFTSDSMTYIGNNVSVAEPVYVDGYWLKPGKAAVRVEITDHYQFSDPASDKAKVVKSTTLHLRLK